MRMYDIRTDLALEQKERFEAEKIEINGVVVEEEYDEEKEIRITTVVIETEKGAKTMGKPTGTYITLEAPNMIMEDEDYHRNISEEIVKHLKNLISGLNSMERYDITDKIVAPHLNGMFVTPKDIDETVKRISYTISEALNILFSNLYSYNDAEIGDGI